MFVVYFGVIIQFTMSNQEELNKLARVAELMDYWTRDENLALREEIQYRVEETDHFFEMSVRLSRMLEEATARRDELARENVRLREERDSFITRNQMLEAWLLNFLVADDDIQSVTSSRPPPPLSDLEYDSDVTIVDGF